FLDLPRGRPLSAPSERFTCNDGLGWRSAGLKVPRSDRQPSPRPARSQKTKSLQTPANRRMKAFSGPAVPRVRLAGLILLLTEKQGVRTAGIEPIVDTAKCPPNDLDEHG